MPVWQNAVEIGEIVFKISAELPKKEDYGLTSQIRTASVSISANIAEAFGRATPLDKSKFYDYARGSAFETKSLLIYGNRVGYFNSEEVEKIYDKLNKVIFDINKVKVTLNKKHTQPYPQP